MKLELTQNHLDTLTEIRRDLHANPELSGFEKNTQQKIKSFLKANTSAEVIEVGGTGVLARFIGKEPGETAMLRADIDALPIQEINTFEYRSNSTGVSHKCGHDGHTTIMLGVAEQLTKNPPRKGEAWLLFQPAEENGKGAQGVLADDQFNMDKVDWVFATHNLPGFERHQIVLKEGPFTGNVSTAIIKLFGKTAHAAEPEKGHNPAGTIARILSWGEEHTLNQPTSNDFFLVTPVYVTMGELAYGISAGYGEVHLTIRSWRTDLFEEKCKQLVDHVNEICAKAHITPEISWAEEFYANINHPEAVAFVSKAADTHSLHKQQVEQPFKWGEDFGLFTQKTKGAMFGIGAGTDMPALHNPDYDFPDEITETGIKLFTGILSQINY